MAKCTRTASARGSTRPTKKPSCSLMTKLATELPSPQQALEAAAVIANVFEPIVAIQEAISDVAPIVSEPAVVIVTYEGTSTIHSSPVMMRGTTTPPHSPTTGLVFSNKCKHFSLFSTLLSLFL